MNVMVQAMARFSTVTDPGTSWLTRILGQVLLDRFLSFRSISPNFGDIGEFQRAVGTR